jgi:hypothetical protein
VATAYVIFKDMRLTVALLFVRPEDELVEIVAALLRRVRILGFRVRRLYLDKGFCSIPIMRAIAQTGWAAILACPIRGKKGGIIQALTGRRPRLSFLVATFWLGGMSRPGRQPAFAQQVVEVSRLNLHRELRFDLPGQLGRSNRLVFFLAAVQPLPDARMGLLGMPIAGK